MITAPARTLLKGAGLRVTEPRLAVIDALRTRPHAAADQIFDAVTTSLPTTSMQAVYNVLRDLTHHGLTRRIEPGDHPARYELRVGDNHHHVVCRACGSITDVDCVVGHAPCLTPADAHGYLVDEADVTFWGTCENCQSSAWVTQASSSMTTHH